MSIANTAVTWTVACFVPRGQPPLPEKEASAMFTTIAPEPPLARARSQPREQG